MIAPLRRRHFIFTAVLGLLTVALVVAALLARPDVPRVDELPAALQANPEAVP